MRDTNEFWSPIKGYEKLYSVSSTGSIRKTYKSGKTKILKPQIVNGFALVRLHKDGNYTQQYIQKIVLDAFINGGSGIIYREDGDKLNNNLENLYYKR